MKSLDVRYNERLVGKLFQDESGKMLFQYDNDWISNGFAISMSLPLRNNMFSESECRPFFEGLLPEGNIRNEIARNLKVSARNEFAILKGIGGDCAGAISIGLSHEVSEKYETQIEGKELIEALKSLNGKPLLAGEKDVRLSIAGSQRKLPVIYRDGNYFIPHGDIPTNCIIKPAIPGYAGTIDNEYFCGILAGSIKLPVPRFEILEFHKAPIEAFSESSITFVTKTEDIHLLDTRYLVIERYDRQQENGRVIRLHQEDLCQASGIPSENKYQKDGGPSFEKLFSMIRKYSSQPALDIKNAVRVAVFNYIIGNADAHGKNFSFLFKNGKIRLAPFYDLLSTEVYGNLDKKMAMKIGGKYDPEDVFRRHWHRFAEEISVSASFVDNQIEYVVKWVEMQSKMIADSYFNRFQRPKVITDILEIISKRLQRLR